MDRPFGVGAVGLPASIKVDFHGEEMLGLV